MLTVHVHAQIGFTSGNSRMLRTGQSLLYWETQIEFSTGRYRSTDYRFEKVMDSLCTSWTVTSCFNAECWNDLIPSGDFSGEFNPDTGKCFIAFHVFSQGIDGRSKIQYRVIHKKDSSDRADLYWDIRYEAALSLQQQALPRAAVFPNPASGVLSLEGLLPFEDNLFRICDQQGRVYSLSYTGEADRPRLDVSGLQAGLYTLQGLSGGRLLSVRFSKI